MQKRTNTVLEQITELNVKDMKEKRCQLVEENAIIGQKNPKDINVEGDTCYNNPIFNNETTPFQAGTIATTTFCENNTKSKKVIGVNIASKVCIIGSRLRNKGKNVTCPNHHGKCTANISPDAVIGDEEKWSASVAQQIQSEVKIVGYTGDGDAKSHQGVSRVTQSKVTHMKDVRHLGNSVRRAVNRANFSAGMFRGTSKCNLRNRLAMSIKQRCTAELTKAHAVYNGNLNAIKKKMPKIIDTIVLCFKGYCGHSCKTNSLVCCGNYRQAKNFMPSNIKLKMTEADELSLIQCIGIMLSPNAIENTRFLTSTQKCEAVNRAYQAVNPKTISNPRSFSGRIHSQIHNLNNGYTRSILLKSKFLGASLPSRSKVIRQMLATDKRNRRRRDPEVLAKKKLRRFASRRQRYELHEKKHYSSGLTDIAPSLNWAKQMQDHNYV
ncbi:lens induction in camera-type eye [Mactra antiquata]